MTRQEVRVEMRFDHFHNAQTICCSISHVLINVALWINHCGKAGGGIAHHVARVGQAFEVVLLKKHIHHPLD